MWAEQEFQIKILDADAAMIETVGAFARHIHYKLILKYGFSAPSEHEVFAKIKNFLVSEFKVNPELIRAEATFVKDLGLE